jgi:hypothetical protein
MQHYLVHTISSKHMRPMMASLFGEMTVLGFLSVVTFCISQAGLLRRLSIQIFGNSEEGKVYLTELFEHVHYLLFAIMVLFIIKVLILLHSANRTISVWRVANKEAQNPDDIKRISEQYLHKKERKWKCTFTRSKTYQFFRFRSLRREFIECRQPFAPFDVADPDKQLPVHFDYAEYLSISLGRFLAEVINVPPSCWISLWLVSGIFFLLFVLLHGDMLLFGLALSFFGLLNLLAIIEVQKKCNWIMDMLLNPRDFPQGLIAFRGAATGVLASRRLRNQVDTSQQHIYDQDIVGESHPLLEPLHSSPSKQERCLSPAPLCLPGWTESVVRRPAAWVTWVFKDDVAPNRQSSLFWLGRPDLNLFLLRLHLVVRSVYIALILAVVVPDLWTEQGKGVAIAMGLLALSFVGWEYAFVMDDLITTMCHVSCCGMLRHISTQEEVLRKQQTRRTFRAIMMMASLVQAMQRQEAAVLAEEGREQPEEDKHVTQAEANDIGSIFDMYDADGSGEIDKEELWKVVESLGFALQQEEMDAMFALLDTNHDGVISRMEFIRWHLMSKDKKKSDMKELARYMFRIFDADNRCVLTLSSSFRHESTCVCIR